MDIFYGVYADMNITKKTNSITIELDDTEQKILLNDLLDWQQWIEDAIVNKLANRKKALKDFWKDKFEQEKSVENIPTDEDLLLDLIFSQPEYKSRVERDESEPVLIGK